MILLPYIHKVKTVNNIIVHAYIFLTIGGTELWVEDSTDSTDSKDSTDSTESVKSILEENEIYTDSVQKKNGIYLCNVSKKTKLTDFYKWNEITDDRFCWRTFYTFGENQRWLPQPQEYISGYSYQELCQMIDI
jgi:hypothetical protein